MSNKRLVAALTVIIGLGGLTFGWAVQRSSSPASVADLRPSSAAPSAEVGPPRQVALSLAAYRAALAQPDRDRAIADLRSVYVDPRTNTPTRREILDALFRIRSVPLRLRALLEAVALDARRPEEDPLWEYATDRLVRVLSDVPLEKARDLMLLEKRARARHLLVAAMVTMAQSKAASGWTEQQRLGLAEDFIDLYFAQETDEYRSQIRQGVQALGGNDVALVLTATAHGVRRNELGVLVRQQEAIETVLQNSRNDEAALAREQE